LAQELLAQLAPFMLTDKAVCYRILKS